MNTVSSTRPMGQEAPSVADQAADSASNAIRATQGATNAAFDRLSDKVEDVRSRAAPVIDRLTSQAESAARRSLDAVRDTSAQVRERALRASDVTVGYIRDEPLKAMLIAAAAGAALMALLSLMGRARDR